MSSKKKEKRKPLGRGLESLLGPISTPAPAPKEVFDKVSDIKLPPDEAVKDAVAMVPVAKIKPNPYQPRTQWNDEDLLEFKGLVVELHKRENR